MDEEHIYFIDGDYIYCRPCGYDGVFPFDFADRHRQFHHELEVARLAEEARRNQEKQKKDAERDRNKARRDKRNARRQNLDKKRKK